MGAIRYETTTPIDKFTIDPITGFLHVKNVPITCEGVRPYRQFDGQRIQEAKTPEELFSAATVDSANNKPVTDDHPTDANGNTIMVNCDNSQRFMKGFMSDHARVDKATKTIRNDLTITDSDLINKIRDGKQELSIGFQMQLDPTKGELNGQAYDAKQTNIRINHVAIVDRGRAGHSVRLTADSAEEIPEDNEKKKGEKMDFTKVHTKQGDISVAVEDADKLTKLVGDADDSNSKLEKLIAERDKLNSQIKELQGSGDKNKKEAADAKKKADEANSRANSAEEENKKLKSQLAGDAFEDRINKTLAFRERAKKVVGDSYDFAGKSEREVEEAALNKNLGEHDYSDKSDDFVSGLYEGLFSTNAGGVSYGRTAGDSNEKTAVEKALEARQNLYEGGNE
jgi:hypothetical protein|nr:MAG TPA: protein of unknown function (DUF2213) [Caudoviricetes sp.]